MAGQAVLASGAGALGFTPSFASGLQDKDIPAQPMQLGAASSFDPSVVEAKARALSKSPYKPGPDVPKPWLGLTYDQYRDIRFQTESALWHDQDTPFQVQFFAPGLYFPKPVQIHAVENATAKPVQFNLANFNLGKVVPKLPESKTLGFSGFRIHTNSFDAPKFGEFSVFQGASYFRAIGRGDTYGLSGRGLALNTGDPSGEEFPDFVEFWIERPAPDSKKATVHALLDSPSVTGAYRFDLVPGDSTIMDVTAVLFPRTDLTHVGIAPQTSMFLFDETNRDRFDDFRPAVHDNDGLMITNGAGEQLWRPLANPKSLQVSSFVDNNPRGFGLMQRARKLDDFADLEARYHNRPGMWIEPGENWGRGSVTLVEIPADREIYDNIVTYWRPHKPIPAGSVYRMSYRAYWGKQPVRDDTVSRVLNTRSGARFGGGRIVTIDFAPHAKIPTNLDDLKPVVNISGGKISPPIVQRNPATGGVRVGFTFYPGEASGMEMRAQLMSDKKTISEVWLYRWTV